MPAEMELQLVAMLLRQGRTLDHLSCGLSLLALGLGLTIVLLAMPAPCAATVAASIVLLGLVQKYWALRVAFDAELFTLLAADASNLEQQTQALDQALANLGLQPANNAGRPWFERGRGALRLLRIQSLLLASQVLLALGAPIIIAWLAVAREGVAHV